MNPAYDAAGNMTTRDLSTAAAQTLTYDDSNRPSTVTQSGVPTATFLYDADGTRVGRKDGGVTTAQVHQLFDWEPTTGFTWFYTHATEPVATRDSSGVTWLFTDHLDTIRATVNPQGIITERRYTPYGEVTATTYPDGTPAGWTEEHGYTNQRHDPTGLYDYRARHYDPLTVTPLAESPQGCSSKFPTLVGCER